MRSAIVLASEAALLVELYPTFAWGGSVLYP